MTEGLKIWQHLKSADYEATKRWQLKGAEAAQFVTRQIVRHAAGLVQNLGAASTVHSHVEGFFCKRKIELTILHLNPQ